MDRLQSMRVFEQVVAENAFAAAARKLDLSPSVVTRLVVELEEHLGVRLLQRTTRRLALTAAGEVYLDRLRDILSLIDEADETARSDARQMSGSIRVLALPGMATHLVAPAIAEFRRQHPKVTIGLHCDTSASRDIESHDITLVTDHVPLPATAVVRPVVRSESILCASPDYLRRHGVPRTPEDLLQHAYVRVVLPGIHPGPLKLAHATKPDREEVVDVNPVLTSNDYEAVLRSTVEGAGISSQAIQVVAPLLRTGQLQRVLAPWVSDRYTLLASFASRRHVPARTRAFLDHLIRHATQAQAGIDAVAGDTPLPTGGAGVIRLAPRHEAVAPALRA
jgi:DNA-binding transcriptional LysR family regulator